MVIFMYILTWLELHIAVKDADEIYFPKYKDDIECPTQVNWWV